MLYVKFYQNCTRLTYISVFNEINIRVGTQTPLHIEIMVFWQIGKKICTGLYAHIHQNHSIKTFGTYRSLRYYYAKYHINN